MEQVRARIHNIIESDFDRYVRDLNKLIEIPSVSWTGFDPANVWKSAEHVAQHAKSLHFFDSVDVLTAKKSDGTGVGQPAVLARKNPRNNAPTVLLYAHHDVQPPGNDNDWKTSPFIPTEVDGRLYGRGSADDKAGIISHLASLEILRELGLTDLGVVLFIEGEEEFGSPSFLNFLHDNHETLRADVIVVADSGNWSTTVPALTVSLRGNVTMVVSVRTLDHALHSGMFGGAVPDAMMAANRLISSFYDDSGAVNIVGLKDFEAKTPEYEIPQLIEESGLMLGVQTIGTGSILSRIWNKPSLTVTGMNFPSLENASNTLTAEVSFKISMRIAPGQSAQEAADLITQHIHDNSPFGAHIAISDLSIGEGYLVDSQGEVVDAMLRSMAGCWGKSPVMMGVGGSIPFISDFSAVFPEAKILITGVEDPDSRAHSPNESLHLGTFRKAIATQACFLAELASAKLMIQE